MIFFVLTFLRLKNNFIQSTSYFFQLFLQVFILFDDFILISTKLRLVNSISGLRIRSFKPFFLTISPFPTFWLNGSFLSRRRPNIGIWRRFMARFLFLRCFEFLFLHWSFIERLVLVGLLGRLLQRGFLSFWLFLRLKNFIILLNLNIWIWLLFPWS
jgi:hypothetical protein